MRKFEVVLWATFETGKSCHYTTTVHVKDEPAAGLQAICDAQGKLYREWPDAIECDYVSSKEITNDED